jgi:hypothetical protein
MYITVSLPPPPVDSKKIFKSLEVDWNILGDPESTSLHIIDMFLKP